MLYSASKFNPLFLILILAFLGTACSSAEETEEETPPTFVGDYLYRQPQQTSDGWEVAMLNQENKAEELVNRIMADSALGISGVLMSQGSKLVLEEYADSLLTDSLLSLGENRLLLTATLTAIYEQEAGGLQQHMVSIPSDVYSGRLSVADTSVALQELLKMGTDLLCRPQHQTFQNVAGQDDDYFYCPANYTAVQQWLEAKTNEPLSFYAEGNLFEPLAVDHYSWEDYEVALSPRDMLKLAALYVQQGRWQEHEIFEDKWVLRLQEKAYDEASLGRFGWGWWQYRLLADGRQYAIFYSKGDHYLLAFVPDLNGGILLSGNLEKPATEYFDLLSEQAIPALKTE